MKTVAIIEGWTEGPATFNKLRSGLAHAGFQNSTNIKTSDVLITHSAGNFFIPTDFTGKLIIMINPAYAMSTSVAAREFRVITLEAPKQIRQWGFMTLLKLRALNVFYMFGHFRRTILIVKLLKRDEVQLPKNAKVILVHNQEDKDHKEFFKRVKQIAPSAKYVEIPGLHEDCLVNPRPYIDLLLKEL